MILDIDRQAKELTTQVLEATASASNESQLQHAIENYLEYTCKTLGITWTPFSVNVSLRRQGNKNPRFADAVHGALIIEYKTPGGFRDSGGRLLRIAKKEAEDYAKLMHVLEGRPIEEYVLVVWDGRRISFGKMVAEIEDWETLVTFDETQAVRLLRLLKSNGRPLVHPTILSQLVGPESQTGTMLIPKLYNVLVDATKKDSPTTRTKLLFTEWNRLFGQVIGTQSTQVQMLVETQCTTHGVRRQDPVVARDVLTEPRDHAMARDFDSQYSDQRIAIIVAVFACNCSPKMYGLRHAPGVRKHENQQMSVAIQHPCATTSSSWPGRRQKMGRLCCWIISQP